MTTMMDKVLVDDPLQQEAINLGCDTSKRIVCITGQAGTGKTTVQRAIHARLADAGYLMGIAAPTGKAAKRITEITGMPAMTLHRMLEYTHPGEPDPKTGKPVGFSYPRRGPGNPLPYDVVFVDEYSMVNQELNRNLIDALKPGGCVRMFGDVNQLPPIEDVDKGRPRGKPPTPSAFSEYLKKFPSVTLKNIYRQGEGSDVVKNAHRILQGWCPMSGGDFIIKATSLQQAELLKQIADRRIDYSTLDNQIITPTHRGFIGTVALNEKLQAIFQSDKMMEAHVMPRAKWDKSSLMLTVGDKVLWTQNDYKLEIFNGESGIVESMEHDQVTINFGDRVVMVPPWVEYMTPDGQVKGYDPRVNLKLAYAITCHAAQGSEYQHVTYVMDNSAFMLQNRSNFYTAVTRAAKHATVITDPRSLQQAVVRQYGL